VVSILATNSVVFWAVNVDVIAGHPNDVTHLHVFLQLEPHKQMVSILTIPKSVYLPHIVFQL
jgi:hypothetical protein